MGKRAPLPIAIKQIEQELRRMGEAGKDLLQQYFTNQLYRRVIRRIKNNLL
ncbi:hypothetical protein [Gloeothece verrucosa]|uniref:hypothetical protein n=1 Tax=Gloeothece verrucosa TaxID=2546359 RepID=UPI00017E2453|nr:hypothetical protein [Gloeothece verrucosa]